MKKILVIDDLPENVFMLQDRLEHEGYEVITAYDGKSGIDKAMSELPDLSFQNTCSRKKNFRYSNNFGHGKIWSRRYKRRIRSRRI